MKTFDIWAEGYRATGEQDGAILMGQAAGDDFKAACTAFFRALGMGGDYFDAERMTYWGCGLFDNEAEARRRFG